MKDEGEVDLSTEHRAVGNASAYAKKTRGCGVGVSLPFHENMDRLGEIDSHFGWLSKQSSHGFRNLQPQGAWQIQQ